MQRRVTFISKLLVRLALSGLAFGVVACSDDEPQAEEPVQPEDVKAGAITGDSEGGEPDADAGGNGSAAAPEPADELDAAMDDAPSIPEPSAPVAPKPMAAPAAPAATPSPSNNGGIISSGVKSGAWEECKKVVKFSQRKKCFEGVLKAQKKQK